MMNGVDGGVPALISPGRNGVRPAHRHFGKTKYP
jgi:hypothetical protein